MRKIFVLLFFCSCDPHDGKLKLVNASSDTVFYSVEGCGKKLTSHPIFIDKNNTKHRSIILPHEEIGYPVTNTWESQINNCSDSSISVYFFSNELIHKTNKDSLVKYQIYSQKRVLKVRDLEKLDWKVIYQ